MDPSLLKPGKTAEVYIPSIDAYYQLDIDFVGENTITVREKKLQQKIRGPVRLKLPEGQAYPLFVWDDDNVYTANTKIIERREEGGLITYVIEKPGEFSVRERRQYIRVSYLQKVYYRVVKKAGRSPENMARSIDLSAGGMRLVVPEHYPPGTELDIKLLIEKNNISARGRVVWTIQKKSSFWLGIDFTGLTINEQDYIIGYVFKKLREQMR